MKERLEKSRRDYRIHFAQTPIRQIPKRAQKTAFLYFMGPITQVTLNI